MKAKITYGKRVFILDQKIVCALLDLQYMMTPETWETVELNHMEQDLAKFFNIIDELDELMHEPKKTWFAKLFRR